MTNVLLVVDILVSFLGESHNLYCGNDALKTIPSGQGLIDRELGSGSRMFFVCDNHDPNDLEFQVFPRHCVTGTREAGVVPKLSTYGGQIAHKRRYRACYGTDLDKPTG